MGVAGVGVAEGSDHVVAIVQQLQVAETALIDLRDAIEAAFDEVGSFDGLNDGGAAGTMGRLQIVEGEGAAHVSLGEFGVDGVEPVKVVVAGVAGLIVWGEVEHESGADGGEAGAFQFGGDVELRSGFGRRGGGPAAYPGRAEGRSGDGARCWRGRHDYACRCRWFGP